MNIKIAKEIDGVIRSVGGHDVWGSFLVSIKGKVVFERGYGKLDYANTDCGPDTIYELGSLSKQFTAAAIMHLVQEKKLETSNRLNELFSGLPDKQGRITVHHLLTHTAGLSKDLGVPYWSTIGRTNYVRKMLENKLETYPGKEFSYSNVGYALLGAVIEEVGGMSYQEYLRQNIFCRAKMDSTGFVGSRDLEKTGKVSVRKEMDTGNILGSAVDWYHYGWGYKGMGGVVSTAHDLLSWSRVLRKNDVLRLGTRKKMFVAHVLDYGYGWKIHKTANGFEKAEHGGGVAGYGAHMIHFLGEKTTVIVLTNDYHKAPLYAKSIEGVLYS